MADFKIGDQVRFDVTEESYSYEKRLFTSHGEVGKITRIAAFFDWIVVIRGSEYPADSDELVLVETSNA